ncbi:hypothetical protein OG883_34550 [Streptomyces sp. NBC_01142]|uniref:hypothetical protein n=1 Tax=Streptomyces sp. NBC_01142 TaxID=2975865 RepID=UPI00224F8CE8|nr:hypothetical protein [Streptomyces sp. NBC_01142]MCX4824888.1 hypothetical protein [Streptomyces sp. NBC_01142]
MTDTRRLYQRPLARAHALAEQWADDQTPITRAEAARQLLEAINPDGWTETDQPTAGLTLVPAEVP